jgi:hypothetical protein
VIAFEARPLVEHQPDIAGLALEPILDPAAEQSAAKAR